MINHIEKHITEAPAPSRGGVFQSSPVVQETVTTRVVNEIQPIIHRESSVAQVQVVQEHFTERVVAPATHTHQVVYESAPVLGQGIEGGLLNQQAGFQQTGFQQTAPTTQKHGHLFHRK